MTTAHRPTFHAAIGGKEQGGGRYIAGVTRVHVHDLAGQMTLKTRVPGQGTADELRGKDLRAELEEREQFYADPPADGRHTSPLVDGTASVGRASTGSAGRSSTSGGRASSGSVGRASTGSGRSH